MRPLSSFNYIKSNKRKVLPSFICTIISVFLIYIFGLLLYGSINDFNKAGGNLTKHGTFVSVSNESEHISSKIYDEINKSSNVKDIIPMLGEDHAFRYNAVFGEEGLDYYNFYSEDVDKVLKNFDLKLTEGRIPKNNADEMLIPEEMARQLNLKVGDTIDKNKNVNINLKKAYKLVGITKGDAWVPIACDTKDIQRKDALKYGILFFLKNPNDMSINNKIESLNDKSLVITDNAQINKEFKQISNSIDFLYVSLSIIIIIVLCISLGNLNYITFINRKNEFAIFKTIGIPKGKLRRKLFKESAIVCFSGYAVGIAISILVTQLLNILVWEPQGNYIPIFRTDSFLAALIIPAAVSIFSMVSTVKEFNKLSYETLNI